MNKDTGLLLNPFCPLDTLEELENSFIKEIAQDVWFLEGYIGLDFFQKPASSNIFILRDGDMVFLFDTGAHPFYRERILNILRNYSRRGARTLVMMVSQGHWDHVINNRIIAEAGFENVRFLLPEPEKSVIDLPYHYINDARALEVYIKDPLENLEFGFKLLEETARPYPAYSEPYYLEVWDAIRALPDKATRPQKMQVFLLYMTRVMMRDYKNMAETAELLPLESRQKKWVGPVKFEGWQVGRFFVIHDASHSPGHVSLYDPLNKLMLTGDATIEINPPFFDGSMENLLGLATKCRILAEAGIIEIATDAHRQANRWPGQERLKIMGLNLLAPIQNTILASGRDQCVAFYKLYEDYYRDLINETEMAHGRIGESTVEGVVSELSKSNNKNVKFKMALGLPHAPSRPNVMVARILKENMSSRRVVDGRILFTPTAKWKF